MDMSCLNYILNRYNNYEIMEKWKKHLILANNNNPNFIIKGFEG